MSRTNVIYAIAGFVGLGILELLASFGAAVLTVRFASRQLGSEKKNAPDALLPALLIILAATGVPAALICGVLLLAMGFGIILAALLLPWFITLSMAILYLHLAEMAVALTPQHLKRCKIIP